MFLVVLALISLLIVPVSAADTYQLRADTQIMTASDVIMPLSTPEDDTEGWYWGLYDMVHDMMEDSDSMMNDLNNLRYDLGFTSEYSMADYLGSMENVLLLLEDYSFYMERALSSIDDAMSTVVGFHPNFTLPAGFNYLRQDGVVAEYSGGNFGSLVRAGFAGLGNHLGVTSGQQVLLENGNSGTTTGTFLFSSMVRRGLLGLSQNIKAISSGSYTLELFNSSTGEVYPSFTASTLGQMMDMYYALMQQDIGKLAFVFADDETIQAKKDSKDNEDAAVGGFLDPDGVGSISASDIGSAADAVGSTKDLFDTGVSPDQAFEQLSGSGPLEFFTSTTAANLDTVPATMSDEDDGFIHFYDPSNSEFFELIGKGGN